MAAAESQHQKRRRAVCFAHETEDTVTKYGHSYILGRLQQMHKQFILFNTLEQYYGSHTTNLAVVKVGSFKYLVVVLQDGQPLVLCLEVCQCILLCCPCHIQDGSALAAHHLDVVQ